MNLTENVGSKYRFIILAGRRVAQLQKGAQPRVETPEKTKMTTIAVQEMNEERLNFKRFDPDALREAGEDGLLPPVDPSLNEVAG